MFKNWNTGDLVDTDNYDGNTSYSTIEGFEVSDKVNKSDLNRPLRNIHENIVHHREFLNNWAKFNGMTNGVLKDGLTQEFEVHGDSDIFSITVTASTGDTTMYYTRMPPGIAKVNDIIVVSKPQTHIAERQLESIFKLESWNDEGVQITYYESTDRFQARIKKRNINGIVVNHDFTNSGTWGDSTTGYLSGIQLLEAIYADTTYFRDDFQSAVGVDLLQIELEPTIKITASSTIYWYINTQGVITGATSSGGSNDLDLCYYTISASGDSYTTLVDERTYIQNFNDFSQHVYLNVPQEWGDTDTTDITNPYKDATVNYANITNQNSFMVFLRKSTGDTYDSSIFGWHENAIPDIDQTRSDTFFMNRDLILITDQSGDTLGSSWVSIKELSGDSWTFYGDKTFNDGFLKQNGTSASFILSSTDADSFKIDTAGGLDIDTDKGFAINDDNGSWITLSDAGVLNIKSNATASIEAGGGTLTLTATGTGANIILNASGDTVQINNGSFYIVSSDTIANSVKIDTSGGIDIDTDNGFTLDIKFIDGAISLASASSKSLTLTATSGVIVTGNELQVDSTVFDINSVTNTFNGTTLTTVMSGAISFTGNSIELYGSGNSFQLNSDGSIESASTNGKDITFTSDNDINFNAVGDTIHWTADTFHLNISEYNLTTGVYTIITGSGQLTLQSSQNDADAIVLDATTGGLTIDAAQDIVITAGDTVKLIGVGSYITNGENIILNTTGSMTLESHDGFTITDNDTSIMSITSSGAITLESKSSQNITITSTSATIDINGNTFLVESGEFDIDSATNTFNGTSLTAIMSGTTSFTESIFIVSASSSATGISLTATNGDIDILANSTSGTVNINGNAISLSASSGSIGINGSGKINIAASNAQMIDLYSNTEIKMRTVSGGYVSLSNSNGFYTDAAFEIDTGKLISISSSNTGLEAIKLSAASGRIHLTSNSFKAEAGTNKGSININSSGDITLNPNSTTTLSGSTLTLNANTVNSSGVSNMGLDATTFSATAAGTSLTALTLSASNGGMLISSKISTKLEGGDIYIRGFGGTSATSIRMNASTITASNTALSNSHFSAYAYISHEDYSASSGSNYAVLQDSSGGTSINAASSQILSFKINGNRYGMLSGSKWAFGSSPGISSSYTVKIMGANSLETVGDIKLGGEIRGGNGSCNLPTYSFNSDSSTGFYRAGASNIGISINSHLRLRINDTYFYPEANNYVSLGYSGRAFKSAYINSIYGTIHTSSQPYITHLGTIPSINIDGGTIDGTTIGGNSAAAGTFSSLTVNGTSAIHNGANFILKSISGSSDPGDIVFQSGDGTEMGRMYCNNALYFNFGPLPTPDSQMYINDQVFKLTSNIGHMGLFIKRGNSSSRAYINFLNEGGTQKAGFALTEHNGSYWDGNDIAIYHGSDANSTVIYFEDNAAHDLYLRTRVIRLNSIGKLAQTNDDSYIHFSDHSYIKWDEANDRFFFMSAGSSVAYFGSSSITLSKSTTVTGTVYGTTGVRVPWQSSSSGMDTNYGVLGSNSGASSYFLQIRVNHSGTPQWNRIGSLASSW